MLTAILLEPGTPLLVRHRCQGLCGHGLPQTDLWTTLGGIVSDRPAFEVPPTGFTLTSYRSGERYFAYQSAGLSLKAVFAGLEEFEVAGGLYRLQSDSALVLNSKREYASLIPGQPTQTFCVSFGQRLVAEVRRAWNASPQELLDSPDSLLPAPELLERVYADSDQLDSLVRALFHGVQGDLDAHELEEGALLLLERLLHNDGRVWAEADRLQIQEDSLRKEALQRLHRARDTMEATWNGRGSLNDWAQVACMSRFHFLRLFKLVFRETPRQFLIRRRLEHASQSLRQSHESVLEIALSCGFETASHFSHSFRQHFGVSPQVWRNSAQR